MAKGEVALPWGEATCSVALQHVCLLVCAGIQLTAFYMERPAVCQVRSHVGITYMTRCVREIEDEVWYFL